jgi:ubiquinol-cytochrome c reductase cytochrome b subunit
VIRRVVQAVDRSTGTAPFLKKTLRYVFPDHWSFMLGEIALYCFVVLVATGVYLTLFFEPSLKETVYDGAYEPLRGVRMSEAYRSAVDLSFEVKAGLLMRQVHHWAADVFVAAIVIHLFRVFFTGAFRRPRGPIYYVGVTLLMLAVLEGFLGYSLVDDLLSGSGLAIAYSVVTAIPFVGANFALLLWGDPFPGAAQFESRIYIAHVLIFPVLIGGLIALHLTLITLTKHTQFRGRREREDNVVGTPLWPGYALRSAGLMFATAGVLVLMGGLIQINPIWQWGPYETWLSENGAQPDWYLGWLIGALRLMPGWEPHAGGYTFIPNAFWGGAFFPLVVFGVLYLYPAIERRLTGDDALHHLLDRPRDRPLRTGFGVGFASWVALVFLAGSSDRIFVELGISYNVQVRAYQVAVFVVPVVVFWLTKKVCEELARSDVHPLRGGRTRVRRTRAGGFEELGED